MNLEKLLLLDARLSGKLSIAGKPGILRSFALFFAHSGDSWFWILGLLLVWFSKNEFWRPRVFIIGISVIITAVIVLLLKFIIRRRRPEGEWGEIYRKSDPHSFPSGHATRSFMLAVMAIGLGPTWFAVLLLLWAPVVGLARVAMGVHYLSDVVVGAILGIVIGWVNYRVIPLLFPTFSIFT